ncbi:thiamine pyrophosphate-binding protein [Limobrevibacterium gyesilva]|uniref:Thiamine pyrophosphate-binding protein n=1 Tax=Limobrevibacterium gyesilva TaxID=2991712 RepID=A0AA41YRR7_9PROT|nr:thiamine pyrophosphate-binding protein [Limobrevibacterium gyesilva]MCW3475315.1 thiamine pyrophosphate-binding protein [Limobrevibacterium gyesilva]
MSYNVGDLVAEFLGLCGVTTAFGVVSVHNIPMLDGIGRRNAIRFVMARGELGAGHMADGYARVTGGLGVLFSSTGPGSANAVAGLVEAGFAGSPVLHITGQTATKFVDRGMGTVHDVPDQLGMLRAVSKAAFRVRSAQQALGVLTEAAVTALTPPCGPVSVEVPIDIQRTPIERPAAFDHFVLPLPPRVQPAAAALDELAERVANARRPLLWLGNGARDAGAAAQGLLDLGFGMVTSWAGRGVVPEDHPMNLGGLNGNGAPEVEAFYQSSDLMLVAGSRLRGHETGEFSVKLPENLLQIDVDPAAEGRTYPTRFFVHGDAALALDGLLQRLKGRLRVDPSFPGEFAAMKQRAQAAFRSTLGPYESFPAQLRVVLPRDAVWVRDITINNSTWGNRLFPLYGPRDNVYPVGAGIGLGLQLGIGAALGANGRKTVVMTGDGGFFLNMTELWTAVQENTDMVVIVMNDRGYGVIKHIQDALYGGRRFYGDLLAPDLQQLAALAGIPSFKVGQADAFGATVAQALATRGPSLVEVDMTAIGEHPPYFPYDRK